MGNKMTKQLGPLNVLEVWNIVLLKHEMQSYISYVYTFYFVIFFQVFFVQVNKEWKMYVSDHTMCSHIVYWGYLY